MRVSPGYRRTGFEIKRVDVHEVVANSALVSDRFGQVHEIALDFLAGGRRPVPGETWIVDSRLGQWSFLYLIAGPTPVWSPSILASTPPSLGATGSIGGWYTREGNVVTGAFEATWLGAGKTEGVGSYYVPVPFPRSKALTAEDVVCTGAVLVGAAAPPVAGLVTIKEQTINLATSTVFAIYSFAPARLAVGANAPWTWAADNRSIRFTFHYRLS